MSAPNQKRLTKISRTLSSILRHKALELKLPIDDQGFIPVERLLNHNYLTNLRVTQEDLEYVVSTNEKQRFAFNSDHTQLRATQGHSIKLKNPILKEITNPKDYPLVIHGTYWAVWPKIKESGQLIRMSRTHIHLAQGLPGQVKSGARHNVDVLIHIDLEKALQAGLKFYESDNGVVLCPGPIPRQFWSKVVNIRTNELMD